MKFLTLTALILACATQSFSANNLPQLKIEKKITGKDHDQIASYFAPHSTPPSSIDDQVQKIILKQVPKEYKNGCREMIAKWGDVAKGTESMVLRALTVIEVPGSAKHIFTALTCFSTAPGYGDKYYDERLIVLSIEKNSTGLSIFTSGKPCSDCSELSNLGLEDDTLSIGDKPVVLLNVGSSSKNPCCDGPFSLKEHKVIFYQVTGKNVRELLSVTMERTENVHDDIMGDSTSQYFALTDYVKDAKNNILQININHKTVINDSISGIGVKSYLWNRKAGRFEEGYQ